MKIKSCFLRLIEKKIDILFLVMGLIMGIFFKWNVLDIVVFLFFIWILLNPIPSRYIALVSMGLLVLVPICLVKGIENTAEQVAIYAYYFLVFTVVMAVYELKKEPKEAD